MTILKLSFLGFILSGQIASVKIMNFVKLLAPTLAKRCHAKAMHLNSGTLLEFSGNVLEF